MINWRKIQALCCSKLVHELQHSSIFSTNDKYNYLYVYCQVKMHSIVHELQHRYYDYYTNTLFLDTSDRSLINNAGHSCMAGKNVQFGLKVYSLTTDKALWSKMQAFCKTCRIKITVQQVVCKHTDP